jgi:hypothetical protein
MKKKILVKFPGLSRSGYGVQARFALRSLRRYEHLFDIYAQNIAWGSTSWISQDDEERAYIDQLLFKTVSYQKSGGQFDISLQVTIPNEFQNLAPINIGYTAGIETATISPKWIECCMPMTRLLVVSNHAKAGFQNTAVIAQNQQTGETIPNFKCPTPVTVINYPVRKVDPDPNFSIDLKYDFNYLIAAQWSIRKNMENTIGWFLEELGGEEVGLVIKANIANDSITDSMYLKERIGSILAKFPDRKCQIYMLTGDMNEDQMAALYSNPKIKAMISLAHGEGFGLPIFEAAFYGIPVITTPYSGPADFMFMPEKRKGKGGKEKNKFMGAKVDFDMAPVQPQAVWAGVIDKEQCWAYPQKNSYRSKLREIRANYPVYKSMAKKLQKHLETNFTEEGKYREFAEAVLGGPIVEVDRTKLPKVSIITSVFKGAEYIEGFMADITRQTMFDRCELILINPASPEREAEEKVILPYLEKFSNITYKVLDKDGGLYNTWNEGIRLATGEYITNANLDDRRAPNCIERCASELFLSPEIDGVYYDQLITSIPNETFESNTANGRKYSFPEYSFENLKMVSLLHAMPMWRKSLHDKSGLFEEKFRSAGDWCFFLKAASEGANYKKIEDILGLYYFSPRGISTNVENFKWKREEEKEVYNRFKDIKI